MRADFLLHCIVDLHCIFYCECVLGSLHCICCMCLDHNCSTGVHFVPLKFCLNLKGFHYLQNPVSMYDAILQHHIFNFIYMHFIWTWVCFAISTTHIFGCPKAVPGARQQNVGQLFRMILTIFFPEKIFLIFSHKSSLLKSLLILFHSSAVWSYVRG